MNKIYITVPRKTNEFQLSFSQLLLIGNDNSLIERLENPIKDTFDTMTYCIDEKRINPDLIFKFNINDIISKLEAFTEKYEELYKVERQSLYYKFYIPKKSKPNATRHCDMREINAPVDELKEALLELKNIFENDCMVKYHTSCFSYVKHRSIKDCLERHKNNGSRWFLKLDMKNFFPSTTKSFIMQQLSMIFPFNLIIKQDRGKIALEKAIDLCILDGGLPQGTPISPLLTNIVMIPIDYTINKTLRKQASEKKFCYTRYADDIQISSPFNFDFQRVEGVLVDILNNFNAPFWLNKDKTRYGSSSGRNWNLGLMINKDGEITIGHEKKREFKAQINNFILNFINNGEYDYKATQKLRGIMSYYASIEKDFVDKVVKHYNEKYNCDTMGIFKQILSGAV